MANIQYFLIKDTKDNSHCYWINRFGYRYYFKMVLIVNGSLGLGSSGLSPRLSGSFTASLGTLLIYESFPK